MARSHAIEYQRKVTHCDTQGGTLVTSYSRVVRCLTHGLAKFRPWADINRNCSRFLLTICLSLQNHAEDMLISHSGEYINKLITKKLDRPRKQRHVKGSYCLCQFVETKVYKTSGWHRILQDAVVAMQILFISSCYIHGLRKSCSERTHVTHDEWWRIERI